MKHPITPPPELVAQWTQLQAAEQAVTDHWQHIATAAAQWGADQELEACCGELRWRGAASEMIKYLRAARRPKPPSLKEQALAALEADPKDGAMIMIDAEQFNTIRRALEQLNE
jgi:hypothetical protein